jgi:hypothetical protein
MFQIGFKPIDARNLPSVYINYPLRNKKGARVQGYAGPGNGVEEVRKDGDYSIFSFEANKGFKGRLG